RPLRPLDAEPRRGGRPGVRYLHIDLDFDAVPPRCKCLRSLEEQAGVAVDPPGPGHARSLEDLEIPEVAAVVPDPRLRRDPLRSTRHLAVDGRFSKRHRAKQPAAGAGPRLLQLDDDREVVTGPEGWPAREDEEGGLVQIAALVAGGKRAADLDL